MRLTRILVPGIVAVAACQPATPAPLSDADRASIEAMGETFAKQALAGDWAGLVKGYYAADAMVLPPNMPAASGHAAIEAVFRTFPPITQFTLHTEEMEASGDLLYLRGRYTMTMAPPGMAAIPDSGKYLEVWRKQSDGTWKNYRDMFSSDIPLPVPDTTAKKP